MKSGCRGCVAGTLSHLQANVDQVRTRPIVWTRLTRNPDTRRTALDRPYFQELVQQRSAIRGVDAAVLSYLLQPDVRVSCVDVDAELPRDLSVRAAGFAQLEREHATFSDRLRLSTSAAAVSALHYAVAS